MTPELNDAVIDANLWIGRVHSSDRFHGQSQIWLNAWLRAGNLITVPTLVLSEVSSALSRRTGQPELGLLAAADLRRIPRLRLIALDESLAQESAHLAATLRLRGADAVYAALALRLNLPLVTWDNELIERTAGHIEAGTPESR